KKSCNLSLSETFFSRHSSPNSLPISHRTPSSPLLSRQRLRQRSLPLSHSSVIFFFDTSTGGDGSSNKNSSSTASTKGVGVKQKTDIAWNMKLLTLEMKLLKMRILWILVLAKLVEMIKLLDISLTIPLFF
ncbi:hypothetical protein LINPERPRIM_LOCUS38404, partial [Linum perenne]